MSSIIPLLAIVTCCYREGIRLDVYKDSLGYATVGIGHRLTEDELRRWKVGDKLPIDVVTALYRQDLEFALEAANDQAQMLNIAHPDFIAALISVNYQLGPHWWKKFKKTWSLLIQRKFLEASEEVKDSLWYKQTPQRVEDFCRVLLTLHDLQISRSD
jgi:GH24 family phage-related lysozyme (muramidase)